MKKKILFFDGDGTLWYPHETKRDRKPWWIYESFPDSYMDLLELDSEAIKLLELLKHNDIKIVILSTHPDSLINANNVLASKIFHLGLEKLVDEYYATQEHHDAKPLKIIELLNRLGFEKKDALMIGDSYNWDYHPAESHGIDALLINSAYHRANLENEPAKKVINSLSEVRNSISFAMSEQQVVK